MADEKLVEEVAQRIHSELYYSDRDCRLALARALLADTALIKRMAEGVGFEVKEKPARYVVEDDDIAVYVVERASRITSGWMEKAAGSPESARRLCQERADELNQKARAADGK